MIGMLLCNAVALLYGGAYIVHSVRNGNGSAAAVTMLLAAVLVALIVLSTKSI